MNNFENRIYSFHLTYFGENVKISTFLIIFQAEKNFYEYHTSFDLDVPSSNKCAKSLPLNFTLKVKG